MLARRYHGNIGEEALSATSLAGRGFPVGSYSVLRGLPPLFSLRIAAIWRK